MEKLIPRISQMQDRLFQDDLLKLFTDLYRRMKSVVLTTAGLVISGTTTLVMTSATLITYLVVDGQVQSIATSTNMPALVGTVVNATYNIFVFSVDKAGNLYTSMGVAGAALNTVAWPTNIPANRAILGFVIIHPTGTGNFVGGTTALGDGTVVPNAVYISPIGMFEPNAAIQ
jgi:hypothetical protein